MRRWVPLMLAATVSLSSCATHPTQTSAPPEPPLAPNPPSASSGTAEIPDAVPRIEPRSRYGNPPYYEVMGKRYYVLSSSSAYVERGVASWYGPGFHQVRTSSGDTYDMYGMTAAHKTLPLPAYARVTNLLNGRTCIVRINDRGPFVGNRIIDLSYSAAAKLDMLRNGTAMVEVRVIDPALSSSAPLTTDTAASTPDITPAVPTVGAALAAPSMLTSTPPVTANASGARVAVPKALFVQAGAFANSDNAERLASRLRDGDYGRVFVRADAVAGRTLFRVRIGPVPNVPEFDRIVAALEQAGVHDAHLAMD